MIIIVFVNKGYIAALYVQTPALAQVWAVWGKPPET